MASKDNSDGFGWQRYEAEVVDLDAECARRAPADLDDQADATPVDSPEAQRVPRWPSGTSTSPTQSSRTWRSESRRPDLAA